MSKEIEFTQVTTKGGDTGYSTTGTGDTLLKSDIYFETLGDIDELNSFIGLYIARMHYEQVYVKELKTRVETLLEDIQKNLYNLMGEIAFSPYRSAKSITRTDKDTLNRLEIIEDALLEETWIEHGFVNPGGGKEKSAYCDVCRTITRRCERKIVRMIREAGRKDLEDFVLPFFNRLSDFFFVLGRYLANKN